METFLNARDIYYDDVPVGETIAFARRKVSREEMVAFATAFDPQAFHLSDEGARDTIPGRMFASGFHTCAMLMGMIAEGLLGGDTALGSPGLEEVRFLKPVFPGDELTARYTCAEKRELRSKPGVGVCRMIYELLNGDGDAVIRWDCSVFLRTRAGVSP